MSVEDFYPQREDPHYLVHAKAGLLTIWHELPPEDQATMLLALFSDVMQGEYARWIRHTMTRLYCNEEQESTE